MTPEPQKEAALAPGQGREVALGDGKATTDDAAPSTSSRNARTAPVASPLPPESPFVERSAIEALDRIAFLFHIQSEGRGKKLTLATDTLFAPGSDVLDPTSPLRLQGLATALKAQGPHRIRVRSFTDSLGDPQENLMLSERRANALRDYLLAQGVRPDRIVAEGGGATRPIASNATPDGRASNRRIEIVIE
jgi:outer membrane protein OmpA-like peptidoglycan-associated protein